MWEELPDCHEESSSMRPREKTHRVRASGPAVRRLLLFVFRLAFFTPTEKRACDLRSQPALFPGDTVHMPLWALLDLFGHVTNQTLPGHSFHWVSFVRIRESGCCGDPSRSSLCAQSGDVSG